MSLFKRRVSKNFVSEAGEFLKEFDKKPEAHSKSRRAEEQKYEQVHALRDHPIPEKRKD